MPDQTDVITHRVVYNTECSKLVASLDKALHDLCQLVDTDSEHVAQEAHDNLHALSERLVDNELAHDRAMAEGGWQPVKVRPKDGQRVWIFGGEIQTPHSTTVNIRWADKIDWHGLTHWCPADPPAPPTPTTEAESRT